MEPMHTVQWLMDEYNEWHAYVAVDGLVLPRSTALCGCHCLTGFLMNPIEPVGGKEAIPNEGEREGAIHGACMTAYQERTVQVHAAA